MYSASGPPARVRRPDVEHGLVIRVKITARKSAVLMRKGMAHSRMSETGPRLLAVLLSTGEIATIAIGEHVGAGLRGQRRRVETV